MAAMSNVLRDRAGHEIRGVLTPSRPESLLIVHDLFGLTGHLRKVAQHFATTGFTTFAIDLFGGATTDDEVKGFNLVQTMYWKWALERLRATIDALRDFNDGAKVAILGFGMGGGVSLATASHVTTVSACVSFYGIPATERGDLLRIGCPVQGHFALHDKMFTKDRVDALETRLKEAGIPVEFHRYLVGHYFYDESRKATYSSHNADLAFHRCVAFLKRSMGATW